MRGFYANGPAKQWLTSRHVIGRAEQTSLYDVILYHHEQVLQRIDPHGQPSIGSFSIIVIHINPHAL